MWVVIDDEQNQVFGPFVRKEAAESWANSTAGPDKWRTVKMIAPARRQASREGR